MRKFFKSEKKKKKKKNVIHYVVKQKNYCKDIKNDILTN